MKVLPDTSLFCPARIFCSPCENELLSLHSCKQIHEKWEALEKMLKEKMKEDKQSQPNPISKIVQLIVLLASSIETTREGSIFRCR